MVMPIFVIIELLNCIFIQLYKLNMTRNRDLPTAFLIIFLLTSFNIYGQAECPCCTEYHNQFDFWVGDWIVYDSAGNVVGENTISKLENNCLVSEYWKGAKGMTGRSYNYFNVTDSTWNQVWIDSNGNNLVLKGGSHYGEMVLKSELIPGQNIDFYANQITWTSNKDGTVTQLWQILDKNDQILSTVFEGIYKKRER